MMIQTDLAFLDQTCPTEHARIEFLINRDGLQAAYEWVKRTQSIYLRHVQYLRSEKKLTPYYRRVFIISCVEFRTFIRNYRKAVDLI